MYETSPYGQGYQQAYAQPSMAQPYGQPYDQQYGQAPSSPYNYAGNPAYTFLDENMQQAINPTSQGALAGRFNQVLNSMSGSINQNASQGFVPLFGGAQAAQYNVNAAQAQSLGVKTYGGLTLAQVAQQMNTGGAASVLPYMGMNALPQIVFPVAGLWTLYDGMKAVGSMRRDAAYDRANSRNFNPSELNYNKTVEQMNSMNDEYAYLGPLY